jgi:chromosome partitioning protein
MIVTVGNTKGGVGKTTLALNIAIARALQGRDIWLIDGDRQGTAQTAITIRAEARRLPAIACAQYPDGSALRNQVLQTGKKFDDVIIDAGGRDSTALRAAMALSDTLVVPFAPRSLDVWALADISTLIAEIRSIRPELRALAVLNNADSGGHDNEEAAAAVADFPELEYIATPIRRRKQIANAAGQGMSALEYSPKDAKAIDEMNALVSAVFTLK